MGYKKPEKTISFAELSLRKSIANSRSVAMMERINTTVLWTNIEALLAIRSKDILSKWIWIWASSGEANRPKD